MRDKESEIEDDKAAQRIIEMRDKHKKEQQKSLPQVQSTMPIKTNRITFRRGQVDEGKNDS
jgi:hypothetical protein